MKCPECKGETVSIPSGQGHEVIQNVPCDLCGSGGVLFMPQKEVDLFGNICMTVMLQSGHGYRMKAPEQVIQKIEMKKISYVIWTACGLIIKHRIEEYCRTWYLPFDKWMLFIDVERKRRREHPGLYTLAGNLRKEVDKIAKNKYEVMHAIEMIKATGASSVSEAIEVLINEVS